MTSDPSQLRALHVVASINAFTGGPALSVTRLADALRAENVFAEVFTLNYGDDQIRPQDVPVTSVEATWIAKHFRGFSPESAAAIESKGVKCRYYSQSWAVDVS